MTAKEGVLWIGGSSGSGKSTVARLLARRHGLRWYSSDTRTWEHRDRAVAAGNEAAIEWEQLTPQQRSQLPIADTIRLAIGRSEMVLRDVAALPDRPSVVAEGTTVMPSMLPQLGLAIWLTASVAVRAERTKQRGWGDAGGEADRVRERELLDEIDRTSAILIDTGDQANPLVILTMVEEIAAGWLSAQPLARDRRERQSLIREGNAAIVAQYRGGMARAGNTAGGGGLIRAYDCECGLLDCTAIVDRTLDSLPEPFTLDAAPILALGHRP